jgi:hypothetical protein
MPRNFSINEKKTKNISFFFSQIFNPYRTKSLRSAVHSPVEPLNKVELYIHTTHSLSPKGLAEVSQIFLRDTHVLPKLASYEEHCRRDRW